MKQRLAFSVAVLLALSLSPAIGAQNKDPLLGAWTGTLELESVKLRLVFEYELNPDGKRRGFIISPDQSARRIPITRTTRAGEDIVVVVESIDAVFMAKYDPRNKIMKGEFVQRGQNTDLEMAFSPDGWRLTEFAIKDEDRVLGTWTGKLNMGAMDLALVLECTRHKDTGEFKAVLVAPDQSKARVPLTKLSLDKDAIRWQVGAINGVFEGKLDDDKREMDGTWKQNHFALPLTLKRSGKSWARKRPQTPMPPFPYNAEEVTFPNTRGGHELAGTLTLPKRGENLTAVVTITGSGPQDRDNTLLQHKPFAVIADHLTRNGIAVLRFDDRGVGRSGGNFAEATTLDFSSDAWAAAEYLRTRKEIDPNRIGLLGHSEGGLVAPMVAADHGDVAFMVLLAGPGVPVEELLDRQNQDIGEMLGLPRQAIDLGRRLWKDVIRMIRDGAGDEAIEKKSEQASEQVLGTLSEAQRKIYEPIQKLNSKKIATPWYRHLLDIDPGVSLRKVTCPVLALNGELDIQVAPGPNLAGIRKHLEESGNGAVTVRELKGLNHLFQNAKTGNIREYVEIEETFDPGALNIISEWIKDL